MNTLIMHEANESRLKKLSNLQAMILKHALSKFPCARRIVYSTCSIEEKENEGVVSECLDLAQEEGFSLVPIGSAFKGSFEAGRGSSSSSASVIRLGPERDLTNGFFIAVFERSVPPSVPSESTTASKLVKNKVETDTSSDDDESGSAQLGKKYNTNDTNESLSSGMTKDNELDNINGKNKKMKLCVRRAHSSNQIKKIKKSSQ